MNYFEKIIYRSLALLFFLASLLLPMEQVFALTLNGVNLSVAQSVSMSQPPVKTNRVSPKSKTAPDAIALRNSAHQARRTLARVNHSATESSSVISNAYNFSEVYGTEVNSRTGTVGSDIKVGELFAGEGHGKNVSLSLGYSSGSQANLFGLGRGWGFNIGTISDNGVKHDIGGGKVEVWSVNTAGGEDITFLRPNSNTFIPLYHKVDDYRLVKDTDGWLLTLKDGEKVHFKNYIEDWEETENGYRVTYDISTTDGGYRLHQICGETSTGEASSCIRVSTGQQIGETDVTSLAQNGEPVVVRLFTNHTKGELSRVELPTPNDALVRDQQTLSAQQQRLGLVDLPAQTTPIEIKYSYRQYHLSSGAVILLSTILYPTGSRETIDYNTDSEMQMPGTGEGGAPKEFLPVVSSDEMYPNKDNTADKMTTRYYYDNWPMMNGYIKNHNYLGLNSGQVYKPGEDNAFDQPRGYEYQTVEMSGHIAELRTYNQWHLLVSDKKVSARAPDNIYQDQELEYTSFGDPRADTTPAWYSLPLKENTLLYDSYMGGYRHTPLTLSSTAEYDDAGNIVRSTDAYGITKLTSYCPLAGDASCPIANPDFPFITDEETMTVIPAGHPQDREDKRGFVRQKTVEGTAAQPPILVTHNHYKAMARHHSDGRNTADYQTGKDTYSVLAGQTRSYLAGIAAAHFNARGGAFSSEMPIAEETRHYVAEATDSTTNGFDYGWVKQINYRNEFADNQGVKVQHYRDRFAQLSGHRLSIAGKLGGVEGQPAELDAGTGVYSQQTGLQLAIYSSTGMETTQQVDTLGRVISETTAPTSEASGNEAFIPQTTRYQYLMGKTNELLITASDGNQEKIIYDGVGRQVKTCHLDRMATGFNLGAAEDDQQCSTGGWVLDSNKHYDDFDGQLASMTTYQLRGLDKTRQEVIDAPLALTTHYYYDQENRLAEEVGTDGSHQLTVYDDTDLGQLQLGYVDKAGVKTFIPMLSAEYTNSVEEVVDSYQIALDPEAKRDDGTALYTAAQQAELVSIEQTIRTGGEYQEALIDFVREVSGEDQLNAAPEAAEAHVLGHIHTDYDGFGRAVDMIDELSKNKAVHSEMVYDANGEEKSTVDAKGDRIEYRYDGLGNVLSKDYQPADKTTKALTPGKRDYNTLNQLTEDALSDGTVAVKTAYDKEGRIKTMTYANGTKVGFDYNAVDQLADGTVNGQLYQQMAYDPNTWEMRTTEDNTGVTAYHYNKNNLVDTIEHCSGPLLGEYDACHQAFTSDPIKIGVNARVPDTVSKMHYDRFGQLEDTQLTVYTADDKTPLLSLISWGELDDLGREIADYQQMDSTLGDEQGVITLAKYNYSDPLDRLIAVDYSSGLVRSNVYNDRGELKEYTDTVGGIVFNHWQMHYRYDGDMLKISRHGRNGVSIQRYGYDDVNNLVEYHCHADADDESLCPLDTDMLGYQNSASTHPEDDKLELLSQHYTMDDFNNIDTIVEKLKVAQTQQIIHKKIIYHYEQDIPAHRLRLRNYTVQWEIGSQGHYGTAFRAPHDIEYNQLGQVISDMNGDRLQYNAMNQLSDYTSALSGATTHYAYNGAGEQISETVPGEAPLYRFYSGNAVMLQVQSDAPETTDAKEHFVFREGPYVYTDGRLSAIYELGLNGSVESILNPDNSVRDSIAYMPYGLRTDRYSNDSAATRLHHNSLPKLLSENQWGFDDEITDRPTGYQFLGKGYRAYNPKLRRFMQHDSSSPFGVGGMNGYAFVSNNPIMSTDPSGHMSGAAQGGMTIGFSILGAMASVAVAVFTLGAGAPVAVAGMTAAGAALGVAGGALGLASGGLSIHADKQDDGTAEGAENAQGTYETVTALNLASAGMFLLGGALNLAGGIGVAKAAGSGMKSMIMLGGVGFFGDTVNAGSAIADGVDIYHYGGENAAAEGVSMGLMALGIASTILSLGGGIIHGRTRLENKAQGTRAFGKKAGGCFTGDTLVAVYSRKTHSTIEVPIKDIKLGDLVITDVDNKTHKQSEHSEVKKKAAKIKHKHTIKKRHHNKVRHHDKGANAKSYVSIHRKPQAAL